MASPRNHDCQEEEDPSEDHEDAVGELAALLEEDVQREGVGGDLRHAVQEKVDHHCAPLEKPGLNLNEFQSDQADAKSKAVPHQIARVESEAVVDERVGEPVEVEDERLLGHVGRPEQGQQIRLPAPRGGLDHRFQVPVVGVSFFTVDLKCIS